MKNNGKRSTVLALGASLATATLLASTVGAANAAPVDELEPALLYEFDGDVTDSAGDYDGTIVGTGVTFSDDGLVLPGGSSGSNAARVEVPTAVFENEETVSISMWLENETGDANYAAAYVGGTSQQNGYWLFNPASPEGRVKSVITSATAENPTDSPWAAEIGSANPGRAAAEGFNHYTTVIDSDAGIFSVYVNGILISEDAITTNLTDFGTLRADIGRSAYPDQFFKGTIKEYRVDHAALTAAEVRALFEDGGGDFDEVVDSAAAAITLPDSVSEDFFLPLSSEGMRVAWSVESGDAISISGSIARVTQPVKDAGDANVKLRATFSSGDEEFGTADYEVSVLASDKDLSDLLAEDVAALEILNADDIRTNFSVPARGANGSVMEWTVESGPLTLNPDADDLITVAVERPETGAAPATAELSVTVSLDGESEELTFPLVITPLPDSDEEMEAYFWSFFTGEGQGAEKTSFAASQGNDALAWNVLNDGYPVIESTEGTEGLRDPFIIRSQEGDKFYMIATDLKIDGLAGGFTTAQISGSRYLEIWESTDLVNWGEQRHVEVSSIYAGNTWAPEAFFDDETGKYVVYWASNLYDEPNPANRGGVTYNRMMYSLTEDFIHFTEPEIWIDVDQGNGNGTIDVSSAKEGDWYYRVYKDESDMTLRQEKSKTFLAKHNGESALPGTHDDENRWSLIVDKFAAGLPNGAGGTFRQGEGPSIFPANPGDVNGYEWYVWIDQPDYHGGPNHYVPFATEKSLAETGGDDWVPVADKLIETLPENADGGKPRHGTVIPITRSEYQGVLEHFQPDLAVASAEGIAAETEVGEVPELPETIELTMFDGAVQEVPVMWDAIDADDLAAEGVVTLTGTAQDASRFPVTAEVTVIAADDNGNGEEPGDGDDGNGEDPGDGDNGNGEQPGDGEEPGDDTDDTDDGDADQDGAGTDAGKKDPESLPRTGASTLLLLGVALLLGALGLGLSRVSKRETN